MAANSYTWHIQVIVKKDTVLDPVLKARWDALTGGEGQNKVELANGDVYIKDFFMGKENLDELWELAEARKAGKVIVMNSKDMTEYLKTAPRAVEI